MVIVLKSEGEAWARDVEIRWKPEKAILVGEADGGDVDGLGDRYYVTKWDLKRAV